MPNGTEAVEAQGASVPSLEGGAGLDPQADVAVEGDIAAGLRAHRAQRATEAPPAETPDPEPAAEASTDEKPAAEPAKTAAEPEEKQDESYEALGKLQRYRKHVEAKTRRGLQELAEQRRALQEERAAFERERSSSKPAKSTERSDTVPVAEILADPVGFFESRGYEPADLGRMFYAKKLGKDAPEELKLLQRQMRDREENKGELAAVKAEFAEFKRRVEEQQQQAEAEKVFNNYRSQCDTYLDKLPKELKLVGKQVAKNRARALDRMWDLTVRYATEYPNDRPPTPDEVAEWYEEVLQDELSPFLDEGRETKTERETPKPQGKAPKQPTQDDLAGRVTQGSELPEDPEELEAMVADGLRNHRKRSREARRALGA